MDELLIPALNSETGQIEIRPMTDEERTDFLDGREERAATALDWQREQRASLVLAALAASDKWAARAFEDGTTMAPERVAYRQELRALLAEISSSDDPAAIELPDPPPNPKAS